MIQPVTTLSPKVRFRGENASSAKSEVGKYRRRFAYASAVGASMALGAVTTVIARNYTANWAHSGIYGMMGTAAALMFLVPGFKYKADAETAALIKNTDKKVIMDSAVSSSRKKIFKNTLRKAV
jgi:hypothetical protein